MHLLEQNYRDKKVFLSGHTGFKGTWLSLWLQWLGAKVMGYSLDPPSMPNMFETMNVAPKLAHIRGDVRDFNKLSEAAARFEPDIVFHLAAQPLVRLSYKNPRLTYDVNVMGTVNTLEMVRNTPSVRAAVIVTSDKCYENREWVWGYREDEPMGGRDPYSSSKGCCELVTSAFLRSFFPPEEYGRTHNVAIASARAGNVIGGGDWGGDRLVPDCIRALTRDEEIVLRSPDSVRPWQHVLDPLGGYLALGSLLLTDGPRFAGAWNFGPSENGAWSVKEVVSEVIRLWGKGGYRVESTGNAHEAHLLKLDCSKAGKYLGWRPRYDVKTALAMTVEWYRRFYSDEGKATLRDFTVDQIAAHVR
ncbi:MAG: CDP-glucose 4,6-dehydratase [Desulfobacteraceae bacterium]|nr:CDP-glucose 4,6-dehydratase [Desulfobacteraceae bacterium]